MINKRVNLIANNKLYKYSSIILLIIFFTPFVTFGLFRSDISPFYLSFYFLFFIFYINQYKRLNKKIVYILIIIVYLLIVELSNPNISIETIKFCMSLLLFSSIFIYFSKKNRIITPKQIFYVSLLWFAFTLLSIIFPDIIQLFLYRVSSGVGRGASGLSPEPAYWGFASSLMLLILYEVYIDYRKTFLFYFSVLIFSLSCIMSLSILGILYLGLVTWFIFGLKKTFIVFSIILGIILFLLPSSIRIISILNLILESGPQVLLKDISAFYRINDFLVPYYLLNGDIPYLGTFGLSLNLYDEFEPIKALSSGITILIIRYGYLGLLVSMFICYVYFSLINHFFLKSFTFIKRIPIYFMIILILFVGPLAFPYFVIAMFISGRINHKNYTISS